MQDRKTGTATAPALEEARETSVVPRRAHSLLPVISPPVFPKLLPSLSQQLSSPCAFCSSLEREALREALGKVVLAGGSLVSSRALGLCHFALREFADTAGQEGVRPST